MKRIIIEDLGITFQLEEANDMAHDAKENVSSIVIPNGSNFCIARPSSERESCCNPSFFNKSTETSEAKAWQAADQQLATEQRIRLQMTGSAQRQPSMTEEQIRRDMVVMAGVREDQAVYAQARKEPRADNRIYGRVDELFGGTPIAEGTRLHYEKTVEPKSDKSQVLIGHFYLPGERRGEALDTIFIGRDRRHVNEILTSARSNPTLPIHKVGRSSWRQTNVLAEKLTSLIKMIAEAGSIDEMQILDKNGNKIEFDRSPKTVALNTIISIPYVPSKAETAAKAEAAAEAKAAEAAPAVAVDPSFKSKIQATFAQTDAAKALEAFKKLCGTMDKGIVTKILEDIESATQKLPAAMKSTRLKRIAAYREEFEAMQPQAKKLSK